MNIKIICYLLIIDFYNKCLHVVHDFMPTWIIYNLKRIVFKRHMYRQQITIFFKVVLSNIPCMDDDFHFSSRSKRTYVLYTPFKIEDSCMQQCRCHLYTLNLLLAQSYIPLLLHKYGFIFCYFNYLLHLHKILMLVGILECLCEFQQLAVVLKMFF